MLMKLTPGRDTARDRPDERVLQRPGTKEKERPAGIAVAGPVLRGLVSGAENMRLVEFRQIILNCFKDCSASILVSVITVAVNG